MKRKIRIPILLVLFCFLTLPFKSCVDSDDYDFDKLSDKIDWQPNFSAPVGEGEYSLWYLLDQHEAPGEDQTIILGEDGLIHISYVEKGIFEYGASDVLNFNNDDQLLNNDNIPLPIIPIGTPLGADIAIEEISEFKLSPAESDMILSQVTTSTKISFSLTTPINKDILLEVALLDLDDNLIIKTQDPFELKQIEANPHLFEWELSDVVLPFKTTDPDKYNLVQIRFSVLIKDDGTDVLSTGSNIQISYQLQDIDFKLAKGDFGAQTIDIGTGSIDMGVDFWEDIDGQFTFADPEIKLIMDNKVGVPFLIAANMTASNSDGLTLNLDPENQLPVYPETEAEVLAGVEAIILYDKGNSQIVPFMALPPSGNITYIGSVRLNENLDGTPYNPLADGNNINIISEESSISADLEIDIPMNFKAGNLSISDTIDEVDIDDAEKIINAAIIIKAKNGLPLDVKIESVFFTDAAYTVLSSITEQGIIKAAGVTATGEVDPSTIEEVINRIELSHDQIKSLNDTENIIVKLAVSTYDEGKQAVKLQGNDKLEFSISVSAQLDLSK